MNYRIGEKFNRLTVVSQSETRHGYAVCRCECSIEKEIRVSHVVCGATKSCGCFHSEQASARTSSLHKASITHGKSKTKVHGVWLGMKQRCNNPNSTYYDRYGGRGITVCERWLKFENFLADMGEPAPGLTIERIDNDKGYSPDNCKWSTRLEQQNNRGINRDIEWNGQTNTISQWSKITGVHHNTISQRLALNWPLEMVFSQHKHRDLSGLALGGTLGSQKRKQRTHCRQGHEWTPENTGLQKAGRYCKRCDANRASGRPPGA